MGRGRSKAKQTKVARDLKYNSQDMERTWNCGIGMTAIVSPDSVDLALASLAARGMKAWVAGVVQGRKPSDSRSTLEGTYRAR